jgi:hypothetical protein
LQEQIRKSWSRELRHVFKTKPTPDQVDKFIASWRSQFSHQEGGVLYLHFGPEVLDARTPEEILDNLFYTGSGIGALADSRLFDQEVSACCMDGLEEAAC